MTNDLPGRRTAAHRRPPSFCVLLLLALTVHAAPGGVYRLAGVMSVGEERIGFLEVPSGGQVLVRRGSTVDGGKVTVFDQRELRIVFTDRTVVLELTDSGAAHGANPTLGVVQKQEDHEHAMIREVDPAELMASLGRVGTTAPATATSGKPDARAELGRRFALVANLPPNARVVAINEKPVTTAERALAEIEATLDRGGTARLNLASPPGEPQGRVYLIPATRP